MSSSFGSPSQPSMEESPEVGGDRASKRFCGAPRLALALVLPQAEWLGEDIPGIVPQLAGSPLETIKSERILNLYLRRSLGREKGIGWVCRLFFGAQTLLSAGGLKLVGDLSPQDRVGMCVRAPIPLCPCAGAVAVHQDQPESRGGVHRSCVGKASLHDDTPPSSPVAGA